MSPAVHLRTAGAGDRVDLELGDVGRRTSVSIIEQSSQVRLSA